MNGQGPVEALSAADAALICKALGDANRLQIMQLLTAGEKCACKLLEAFEITQPTLSHHMRILCECGLVRVRREGRWSHYSIDCATLGAFRSFIAGLNCAAGEAADGECLKGGGDGR